MEPHSDDYNPLPQMAAAAGAPPPPTDRRSRRRPPAREVTSRYMMTASALSSSPVPSSISGDLHLPATNPRLFKKPPQHHNNRRTPSAPSSPTSTDSDLDPFADENRHPSATASDTPLPPGILPKPMATQRKRVARLFNDNGGIDQQQLNPDHLKLNSRNPRPGTPMVLPFPLQRNSKGTPRPPTTSRQNLPRSMAAAAASKRRSELSKSNPFAPQQDGGRRSRESSPEPDCSEAEAYVGISGHGGFCESPPLNNCRVRTVSEFRSSMPEGELVPMVLVRRSADVGSVRQDTASLCNRSLSLALSNSQQLMFNPTKMINKPYSQNMLPPVADSRKGKKALNRQEDVHSLRMLHNQYLQWRFTNAKAEATARARAIAAEKSLYDVSVVISELQNSVAIKRVELEELKRTRDTSAIVETQMPYLDEWASVEGDHSSCLSGTIKALQDASLRIPVIGNVRADIAELKEVLETATDSLEELSPAVGKFLPQAEVTEDIIAELASVVSREKTLIEECGDLLVVANNMQVRDSSLRSQIMQLKRSNANGEP